MRRADEVTAASEAAGEAQVLAEETAKHAATTAAKVTEAKTALKTARDDVARERRANEALANDWRDAEASLVESAADAATDASAAVRVEAVTTESVDVAAGRGAIAEAEEKAKEEAGDAAEDAAQDAAEEAARAKRAYEEAADDEKIRKAELEKAEAAMRKEEEREDLKEVRASGRAKRGDKR